MSDCWTSGSLFGRVHRSRRVDQEDEVGARPRRPVHRIALDADADELAARRPGAREHGDIGAERLSRALRRRIVVVEIVDHFLGPDRGRLRQDVLVERGPDPGIGGGVDVDREGRDRRLADDLEGVFGDVGELVAADILVGRRPDARDVAHRRCHRRRWRGRRCRSPNAELALGFNIPHLDARAGHDHRVAGWLLGRFPLLLRSVDRFDALSCARREQQGSHRQTQGTVSAPHENLPRNKRAKSLACS